MKKLFLLLAVFGLMFSACTEGGGIEDDNGTTEQPGGSGNNGSDDKDDDGGKDDNNNGDDEKPEDIFFALDKEEITIKPDGGSAEVVVYSNYKWAISGTSDWCTPSVVSGEANEDGQAVTFSADMTYDSREAVFWFRCADKAIKLVVKQSLKEVIIADDNNTFDVPAEGGTIKIAYQTNVECEVIIPDEAKSWITLAPETKGLVSEKVNLTVAENTAYEARSAVIKVVKKGDGTPCAEYTVNQKQKDAIIADDNNTFEVSAEGGNIEIAYQTNVECEVVIPDEAKEWITIAPETKGLVSEKVNLTVAENKTYEARSAVIKVVKRGDNTPCAEYTVNQKQKDAIIADDNNTFEVPAEGGTIEIAYQTNVECEVIIPDEAKEWITIAPETKGLVSEKTNLNVAENKTYEARSAVIQVVVVGNEKLMAEYTINQACGYILNYTSSNGKIVTPYKRDVFGATIVGNEYKDNIGYLVFDAPITSIGKGAFYDCSSLTSVTIPDSVTKIGDSAFSYCWSLTSVTIPDSVTSIGEAAFYGCSSLTSVTIPDSVTSIGDDAFDCCYNLTSVTIGDSVTSIGGSAFSRCSSLTSFYGKFASSDNRCLIVNGELNSFAPANLTTYSIPDSVTSIGSSAFDYCRSLTSVTIPNSVTEIGDGAFSFCSSLTSITIPDSVTSFGDYAFSFCSSLTSITIPDSVTSIGDYAFYDCSSLTSITIPDSVTSIGEHAFDNCSSLTSVYCKPTTPPMSGNDMFSDNASGRKIYVPTASVDAYKVAAGWKNYASYIVGYDF